MFANVVKQDEPFFAHKLAEQGVKQIVLALD